METKTCKNCKYWDNGHLMSDIEGACDFFYDNDLIVDSFWSRKEISDKLPLITIVLADIDGLMDSKKIKELDISTYFNFYTHKDFGCIHFEKK